MVLEIFLESDALGDTKRVLVERWVFRHDAEVSAGGPVGPDAHSPIRPSVSAAYKQLVVFFRTLHAELRALPAHRYARRAAERLTEDGAETVPSGESGNRQSGAETVRLKLTMLARSSAVVPLPGAALLPDFAKLTKACVVEEQKRRHQWAVSTSGAGGGAGGAAGFKIVGGDVGQGATAAGSQLPENPATESVVGREKFCKAHEDLLKGGGDKVLRSWLVLSPLCRVGCAAVLERSVYLRESNACACEMLPWCTGRGNGY